MCTENYIKSKTPITDLSNYCLSKNANIPTQIYSTTTPTEPIVLTSTLPKLVLPNITIPTINLNKQPDSSPSSTTTATTATVPSFPVSASSNYYYDINKPTKLNLLIQTATMDQSQTETFKPNTNDFSCLINTSSGPSSTTSSLDIESSISSTSSVDGSSSPSNVNASTSIQSTDPSSSSSSSVDNSNSLFYVYSPEHTKKRKLVFNGCLTMEKSVSLTDIIKKEPPTVTTATDKKSPFKKQKKSINSTNITTTDSIKVASPSLTSKRQRSGPSCDCCRSRKIKCDSEITVLSTVSNINSSATTQETPIKESQIAHCSFLFKDESNYQYFQINSNSSSSQQPSSPPLSSVSSSNKLSSFKFLKFKSCSACKLKSLNCCFSKGFTRNDIIKFNKSEKLQSDSNNHHHHQNHRHNSESSTSPTLTNNELSVADANAAKASCIKSTTESLKNSSYLSVLNLSSSTPPVLAPASTASSLLPIPATRHAGHLQKDANPSSAIASTTTTTSSASSNNSMKSSKKTSCKSCRFKKIKCIKIETIASASTNDDGSNSATVCLNCSKKNLNCIYN